MIFSTQQRDILYQVIHQRRDIRHFSGGTVAAFYDRPLLESHGWRERVALERVVAENSYPQDDTLAR